VRFLDILATRTVRTENFELWLRFEIYL